MICYDGRVSLICFLSTSVLFLTIFLPSIHFKVVPTSSPTLLLLIPTLYNIIHYLLIKLVYKGKDYQIATRASFLGTVVSVGVLLWIYGFTTRNFGIYMIIMALFHYSEFLVIAIIHPESLSAETFLLNHSVEYIAAAVLSWIEFFIEVLCFPEMKTYFWLSYLGVFICISGEIIRKVAMLTASSNFTHLVQSVKAEGHVLVTHGVYSFFRHPSYVGWFYWSIGTQIILLNPICIVVYTIASWMFFNGRIRMEEITLLNFFGQEYCDYQQRVSTGLPFIKGYKVRP